jgi:hypothetical protein
MGQEDSECEMGTTHTAVERGLLEEITTFGLFLGWIMRIARLAYP